MNASIIVATYNNKVTLKKTLDALLKQKFNGKHEIIVVNDGSKDGTKAFLEEYKKGKKKLKVFHTPNKGVCRARNKGIANSQYEIVVNMDHDCIAEKDWLQKIVDSFENENIGVVSGYDYYGGTSTGFRKRLLDWVGGYDEEYNYYREDTDLSFKIMDLGFEFKLIKPNYYHDHKEVKPKGFVELLKHVLQRLYYHQNDVLLYKKHPTKTCKEFLHIKGKFLVDPFQDFKVVTGLWEKGGKFGLSSPRGITFLENKSPIHAIIIILGGIGYVIAVKTSRLIGSLRFGKLLI
ncbi:glycosyltransferase family 2 protein [archaeon]|nr:glycosyltransferase family 2 protein [archaeon]